MFDAVYSPLNMILVSRDHAVATLKSCGSASSKLLRKRFWQGFLALLVQVPKTALKTPFRQGTVQDLAKTMLQLSKNGLSRRGNHEEPFLEPLQEIAEVGLAA